jgi:Peptidase family M50.
LLVAAAGAAANLLAAAVLYRFAFQSMRTMFLIAANMAVAAFNLLPIGNLDGGEMLRLMTERAGGVAFSWKIARAASFFALVPLFAAALFVLGQGGNLTLLVTCVYLAAAVIRQM